MTTELKNLMADIADEAAALDLGAYCTPIISKGKHWLDTTRPRSWTTDREIVERAIRYLDLRKKIERHPQKPDLLRVKTSSATGSQR
ncbi:hypothetical protein [Achromobacter pestifer]